MRLGDRREARAHASSSVDQFEIEMRIAATPRHVVMLG